MSDKIELLNIDGFKERLTKQRTVLNLTQKELTKKMGYTHRSKIATWEGTSNKTLPDLHDFYSLCKVLKCDPNYLLGYNDINFTNDGLAAEYTQLSVDTISKLRENPFIAQLINAIVNSDKTPRLIDKIMQLCISESYSLTLEKIFSKDAIEQLIIAFEQFYYKEIALDMCPETFIPYVAKTFPWNRTKRNFKEFLESIIINEKYYDMVFNSDLFAQQTDDERYQSIIYDIAKASYKHLLNIVISKQKESELSHILSIIMNDFVTSQVNEIHKNITET